MDINEKIKKERMVILQTFAEVYLKRNNLPPSKIIFKNEDKYGEINNEQAQLLHFYLEEEYKKMGMDLNFCIKKSGEEYVKGELSKYELNELMSRADDMIIFLGVLTQRKEAAKNNK